MQMEKTNTVMFATASPSEGLANPRYMFAQRSASERLRVLDSSLITVRFQEPQTLWHPLQKLHG